MTAAALVRGPLRYCGGLLRRAAFAKFLIQTVVKGLASEERIADNSSRTPLRSCLAVQGTEQAALRSAGSHSGSDVRKNAGAYFIWLICIFTFFRG